MNPAYKRFRCPALAASRALRFAVCVGIMLFAAACAPKRYHAVDVRRAIAHGDPVRVTMRDGRIFGLNDPAVANDSLRGTVMAKPPHDIAVAVTDVLLVERMQAVGPLKTLVLVTASVIGLILINGAWGQ